MTVINNERRRDTKNTGVNGASPARNSSGSPKGEIVR